MITRSTLTRTTIVLSLLITILLSSPGSHACGPFTLSTIFSFTVHPEYPLKDFAKGNLGIVQPTYARSYLVVAYRHLSGAGFQPKEQEALVNLWRERLNFGWRDNGQDWVKEWLTARNKVPGIATIVQIEVFRSREQPNQYESYLNCTQDAFQSAAKTLNARIERFGAGSTLIKDWIAAQDQVFANCSGGSAIPNAAGPTSEPLVQSDRQYQLAAANLYAGSFSTARKIFDAVSKDDTSPWKDIAPYLAARALVREASLGPEAGKLNALALAEERLQKILNDPAQKGLHAAAHRLMALVLLRSKPETRAMQLAALLTTPQENPSLKQHLWDYTVLLDQLLGDDEQAAKVPESIRTDDLTDWIVTFQESGAASLKHAIERWEGSRSIPWLIAALSKITSDHPISNSVLAAAAEVQPDSPAFATVAYHTVRLAFESGKLEGARAKLDDLLLNHRGNLNPSAINNLTSLRMQLAPSLNDFLKHAQRVPVAFSWNDDGRELPAESEELSAEHKALYGRAMFDIDATTLLNEKFPLTIWKDAATSFAVAPHLLRDLAQAAWLRAVLLDDSATAAALAQTLKLQVPELASHMDEYISATQPVARRSAAIYAWLKFPGIEPIVDTGLGRESPLSQQDSYRDNWWCTAAYPRSTSLEPGTTAFEPLDAIQKGAVPTFITPREASAGKAEWARLSAMGPAPNLLCREVIEWANKRPSDPRVPEALHLAVKTSRYGCTNQETARWSKAAFDVLHKRYPGSIWAKKTPYWFKD